MLDNTASIDQMLGAAIRSARFSRGLTQSDLATLLGLTRATIASYETGRRKLPAEALIHIAHLCGKALTFFDPLNGPIQDVPEAQEQHKQEAIPETSALFPLIQILQLRPDLIPIVSEFVDAWLGEHHG